MVVYLCFLFLFSCLALHHPERIFNGVIIVLLYSIMDLVWTRIQSHTWMLPISSWISGLVISIVTLTHPSILLMILLPLLAVISKHLLHVGKSRHIWNPAGFSLTILALFMPVISWWTVSWGIIPTVIVLLMGLFILWRLERWHVTLSFLLSFIIVYAPILFWGGSDMLHVFNTFSDLFSNGALIFFATVMLVEPVTSSFPTWKNRVVYGSLVGICFAGISFATRFISFLYLDPLIVSLLLGNVCASLLFLPSAIRSLTKASGSAM